MAATLWKEYETVRIEKEDGITWVILNRPNKRNAMSPQLHFDMLDALTELEVDPETQVLVLTGAGESWCAGQDLREYFRATDKDPAARRKANWSAQEWRWRRLYYFPRPTIAMVNGYVMGGAFTQLIACDFAIAAEHATFGLSEVNWGIFPGGLVSRVVADAMTHRDAMWYIMTGDPFDAKKAAEMRLINHTVPKEKLREETVNLARKLMKKNPQVLRAAKEVFKHCRTMEMGQAEEYMLAKAKALRLSDPEKGYETGVEQFLDAKAYRPGLGEYDRNAPKGKG
ncbi:MAG: p-hydroxycinnamoyl CoA hydratase/lyase [Pseudomonadota bacterium]|nr:p-hydroxycinnamoyl CoA hydratase/lyase [Pseudomonadota bacterium]